jgi:hypothetical protein
MTQVFLSYAEEDQEVAAQLATRLRSKGTVVLWWQDHERRGGQFIKEIENGVATADFFIALMSPSYLSSGWCRRERELALQRETDSGGRFIYVAKVANTEYPESGFLGSYDWLDLVPPVDDSKLESVSKALSGAASIPAPGIGSHLTFRNRDDELNTIRNALSVTGGHDLWLAISPPRMGKSWFLDRLQLELPRGVGGWEMRLVDLREKPLNLRTSAVKLLQELLDLDDKVISDSANLSDQTVRRTIAAAIARRRKRQLYLLDSADLLDTECATRFRGVLTEVYGLLKQTGTTQTRVSVVIGSRRDDDWKGLGRGGLTDVRFRPITLTEFGVDVVHQALLGLGRDLGSDQVRDFAHRLLRLSEGLPALLVRGLRWAEDNEFLAWDQSDQQSTFEQVAGPYVEKDLLSVDSLLPSGGRDLGPATVLIKRALRVLVVYRLFTQSHLRFHVECDPEFQEALAAAGWSLDDLWRELSRTALLKRPLDELWQVVHPPIRRLLYRYYYATDDERCEAHAAARRFYERWTERNAGKEQGVVLLECLWHEATQMIIRNNQEIPDTLPGLAAVLAGEFVKSPIYGPVELSDYVARRLQDDEEFQILLEKFEGLFDRIVESVVATISGGA